MFFSKRIQLYLGWQCSKINICTSQSPLTWGTQLQPIRKQNKARSYLDVLGKTVCNSFLQLLCTFLSWTFGRYLESIRRIVDTTLGQYIGKPKTFPDFFSLKEDALERASEGRKRRGEWESRNEGGRRETRDRERERLICLRHYFETSVTSNQVKYLKILPATRSFLWTVPVLVQCRMSCTGMFKWLQVWLHLYLHLLLELLLK